jgi:hypothetical protein
MEQGHENNLSFKGPAVDFVMHLLIPNALLGAPSVGKSLPGFGRSGQRIAVKTAS